MLCNIRKAKVVSRRDINRNKKKQSRKSFVSFYVFATRMETIITDLANALTKELNANITASTIRMEIVPTLDGKTVVEIKIIPSESNGVAEFFQRTSMIHKKSSDELIRNIMKQEILELKSESNIISKFSSEEKKLEMRIAKCKMERLELEKQENKLNNELTVLNAKKTGELDELKKEIQLADAKISSMFPIFREMVISLFKKINSTIDELNLSFFKHPKKEFISEYKTGVLVNHNIPKDMQRYARNILKLFLIEIFRHTEMITLGDTIDVNFNDSQSESGFPKGYTLVVLSINKNFPSLKNTNTEFPVTVDAWMTFWKAKVKSEVDDCFANAKNTTCKVLMNLPGNMSDYKWKAFKDACTSFDNYDAVLQSVENPSVGIVTITRKSQN